MSRDYILTAEDGTRYSLDNLSTQKWLDGHYSGLDQCCEWLNDRANSLFASRETDAAIALQRLSDDMRQELRPKMIKRADEHRREYPPEVSETAAGDLRGKS